MWKNETGDFVCGVGCSTEGRLLTTFLGDHGVFNADSDCTSTVISLERYGGIEGALEDALVSMTLFTVEEAIAVE